jgi:hypothetical protein
MRKTAHKSPRQSSVRDGRRQVDIDDRAVELRERTSAFCTRPCRLSPHITTAVVATNSAHNRRYALVWVARAVADGTEEDLYELWHDLDEDRKARIANLESDADVDDVREITDAQNRIVAEVNRRRSLPDRIAALRADDDPDRLLPKDTRPRVAAVAETPKPRRYPYGRRGWRRI